MIYPSLNLDARLYLNDANGKPSIASFTRASGATCFDATGKLITCASGVMRHDFDPVTGSYLGWRIESQGTNLLTRSEDFSHADWTKSNVTVTANSTVAPDGSATADTLADTSGVAFGYVQQSVAVANDSLDHTLSCFFYVGTSTNAGLTLVYSGGSSVYLDAAFDLVAGSASTSGSATGSARVRSVGGGFYRCEVTVRNNSSGNTGLSARVYPALASAAAQTNIVAWGAQLEKASFASSYIATVGSQVTRAADVLTVPTSSFAFNASEGSILADWRPMVGGIQTEILRLYDGVANGMTLYRKATNAVCWNFNGQEASQVAVVAGQRSKVAVSYSGSGDGLVIDGGAFNAKTDSAVPTGITTLALSGAAGGGLPQIGGHLRHVAYFPRKLVAAELQDITR